jgi:16S rRNA (uracil1498-N3)-methyltransferase
MALYCRDSSGVSAIGLEGRAALRPPVFVAASAQLQRESIVLAGPEGRHAATVRRLSAGERADVSDGAGAVAECVVTTVTAGVVELRVLARHDEPPPEPRIVIVQAIPKGDRAELAVELMTEVGADVVVPWQAERCVAQWRADRAARALERWRRAAREAAKQSRRHRFPEVTAPAALPDVAALARAAVLAIILDPEAPTALQRIPLPARGDIVVIVGPEGGVSPAESTELADAGAVTARAGPTILRTSTAGAVATAILLAGCGRWD